MPSALRRLRAEPPRREQYRTAMGRCRRSETGQHSPVVTLVPGTFARDAAWTQPDSALSRALLDAGCHVYRFEWSGRNSHRARLRAAGQLAEHLGRLIAKYPGARQFVVAHSHGGNVALHATRQVGKSRDSAARVTAVTLGTPFIHARARAVSGWLVFIVVLFGVALLVSAGGAALTGPRSLHAWATIASGILFATVVALCAVGALMHRKSIGTGWRSRLIASIHAPTVAPTDVIIVRAAGDEASTLLVVGQFVGWLSGVSSRLLSNIWFWACIIAVPQLAILVSAVLDRGGGLALTMLLYGFSIPGFVLLAILTAMLGSSIVFGIDGPFVGIFAFSSAEAAPPGRATLMQLEPFTPTTHRAFAHSRLYDEELVIRGVVESIHTYR